jgi:hypothetical protein
MFYCISSIVYDALLKKCHECRERSCETTMNRVQRGTFIYGVMLFTLLLVPCPRAIASSGRILPLTSIQATIVNSGSTNSCAYTIAILLNSVATYTSCRQEGNGILSPTLTIQFFEHIMTAMTSSIAPPHPCIKPISFGTKTIIQYAGHLTPDISCPGNDNHLTILFSDTRLIQQELGFSLLRKA